MSIDLINFRTLTDIQTQDGRKIKDHLFYRGPAFILSRLSYDTKMMIQDIGFKHIIDFRGYDEVIRAGQVYVPDGCKYENIPAITRAMEVNDDLNTFDHDFSGDYMTRIYARLPFDNAAYKKVFTYIKDDEVPIYFHCSAGKDRTGVCAALIELMLGVSEEDILKDYMKSSDIYSEYYKNILKEPINDAWLCDESWLKASLTMIKRRYDTYEAYFLKEYGLSGDDIKRLKDLYLY